MPGARCKRLLGGSRDTRTSMHGPVAPRLFPPPAPEGDDAAGRDQKHDRFTID
jgi:hypothetical protein